MNEVQGETGFVRMVEEGVSEVTFELRPEGSEGAPQLHARTCQAEGTVGAKAPRQNHVSVA